MTRWHVIMMRRWYKNVMRRCPDTTKTRHDDMTLCWPHSFLLWTHIQEQSVPLKRVKDEPMSVWWLSFGEYRFVVVSRKSHLPQCLHPLTQQVAQDGGEPHCNTWQDHKTTKTPTFGRLPTCQWFFFRFVLSSEVQSVLSCPCFSPCSSPCFSLCFSLCWHVLCVRLWCHLERGTWEDELWKGAFWNDGNV